MFKTFYEETNKGHQMNTSDLHFIWFTKIQKFSVAQSSYCTPKLHLSYCINHTTSHVHRISLLGIFLCFFFNIYIYTHTHSNNTYTNIPKPNKILIQYIIIRSRLSEPGKLLFIINVIYKNSTLT